jgi:hypothetical protein
MYNNNDDKYNEYYIKNVLPLHGTNRVIGIDYILMHENDNDVLDVSPSF